MFRSSQLYNFVGLMVFTAETAAAAAALHPATTHIGLILICTVHGDSSTAAAAAAMHPASTHIGLIPRCTVHGESSTAAAAAAGAGLAVAMVQKHIIKIC